MRRLRAQRILGQQDDTRVRENAVTKMEKLTYPFQILSMTVTQLVLQHRQKIRNDVQPLREQSYTLIHLEVTAHSLVYRLQLWLCPHELWTV